MQSCSLAVNGSGINVPCKVGVCIGLEVVFNLLRCHSFDEELEVLDDLGLLHHASGELMNDCLARTCESSCIH